MVRILTRLFGIDLRSLAALRIGLGLLLLTDLAARARDLQAHYSDVGVLPRTLLVERYQETWIWSIHMLSGSAVFEAMLFVAAGVAALALTLGFYSRPASIVSWLLLVSLHVRNPVINNGGDILIRSVLFWAMLLPLDGRWAVRPRRRTQPLTTPYLSVASAAVLIQFALMYWMAGYYKLYGGWQSSNVLQQIMQTDCYARPLAYTLLEYPRLLGVLGWMSLWSELVLPWLLFSPVWTRQIRTVTALWFVLFHLGIQLTLTVGLFSFVSCVAWVLFIPPSLWERMGVTAEDAVSDDDVQHQGASTKPKWAVASKVVVNGAAALMIAYIILWNVSHLPAAWTTGLMPRSWYRVADVMNCRQKWNLFQSPMRNDGWYVVAAHLDDGTTIDLLRGGAPADWDSYRKPKYIYRRFPNHRWRKYYRNLLSDHFAVYRQPLCRYLATHWEAAHPNGARIESVELQYMQEVGADPAEDDRFQQRFLSTWTATSRDRFGAGL